MANRYPLVVDTTSGNQIKELPAGDNLNLTGNGLIGVTSLAVVEGISSATVQTSGNATVGGSITVTGSATITGSISTNANLDVTGVVRLNGTNILELVNWNDLIDVPNFAEVALTASYNDLVDTPNFASVALSGSYNDLTNKPAFATVATSGSYNDLINKPVFATVATTGSYLNLTNRPVIPSDVSELTDTTNLLDSETLDSVTVRGSITTNSITVGSLSSNGEVYGTSLRTIGDLTFDTVATSTIDTGAGGTLIVGGGASLQLKSQTPISVFNSVLPETTNAYNLGSATRYFSNSYVQNTVYYGDLQGIPGKTSVTISAANNINISAGTATGRVDIFQGVFKLPNLTTTQRNALSPQFGDIIYNGTTSQVQVYVQIASYNGFEPIPGWVNLYNPPPQPT